MVLLLVVGKAVDSVELAALARVSTGHQKVSVELVSIRSLHQNRLIQPHVVGRADRSKNVPGRQWTQRVVVPGGSSAAWQSPWESGFKGTGSRR
jgi:hypothetical protein